MADKKGRLALKALEEIRESVLECPVCMCRYTPIGSFVDSKEFVDRTPKMLECHHCFCMFCLQAVIDTQALIKCPICTFITNMKGKTLSNLYNNFVIDNLLRITNLDVSEDPKSDNSNCFRSSNSIIGGDGSTNNYSSSYTNGSKTSNTQPLSPHICETSGCLCHEFVSSLNDDKICACNHSRTSHNFQEVASGWSATESNAEDLTRISVAHGALGIAGGGEGGCNSPFEGSSNVVGGSASPSTTSLLYLHCPGYQWRLRASPSMASATVGTFDSGQTLSLDLLSPTTIVDNLFYKYALDGPNFGQSCYVMMWTSTHKVPWEIRKQSRRVRVACKAYEVRIRQLPSPNATVVTTITDGEELEIFLQKSDNYYKLTNGLGFILASIEGVAFITTASFP